MDMGNTVSPRQLAVKEASIQVPDLGIPTDLELEESASELEALDPSSALSPLQQVNLIIESEQSEGGQEQRQSPALSLVQVNLPAQVETPLAMRDDSQATAISPSAMMTSFPAHNIPAHETEEQMQPTKATIMRAAPPSDEGPATDCVKCQGLGGVWGQRRVKDNLHDARERAKNEGHVGGERFCYRWMRFVCKECKWPTGRKRAWPTMTNKQKEARYGLLDAKIRGLIEHTCEVCGETKVESAFPVLVTETCPHGPSACKVCVETWIVARLDSGIFDIACPCCDEKVDPSDIQRNASTHTWQRFLDMTLKTNLSNDATFHHCSNSRCNSGQYLTEHPTDFICQDCNQTFCMKHDPPATQHDGMTCQVFDLERSKENERKRKREEEEMQNALSVEKVKRIAQECPKCKVPIAKNGGCDHMTCKLCRYEFCYKCGADYKSIRLHGNHEHKPSCKYHTKNLFRRA